MAKQENKTVAQNKKAYHDYFVLETYEAGIELFGTEIKSVRAGKLNLKDSWCNVVNGEMLANGVHISPYEMGNRFNRDPLRPKRLLMHKKEIMKLMGEVKQQGCALIPLSVYFNERGKAKMLVGLCKGKKNYDKRETEAKRDAERNIQRAMSLKNQQKLEAKLPLNTLHYSLFTLRLSEAIYGDERISTGILNRYKRAEAWYRFKNHTFKNN